jgi:hypothetical protein
MILSLFLLVPLNVPAEKTAADAFNVRLIGWSDLQRRPALQVVLKGNYAYVGHHRGRKLNPLTGKQEWNGTTILDVADPSKPKILTHIPGYEGAESRAVQVVENYFQGKDFLLRNQESGPFTGFEIWDITKRSAPKLISQIGSLSSAHKSWWDGESDYAYLSGIQPGWKGQHLIIYDLKNPYQPQFVSNWGLPGQAPGESGKWISLHHPVISGDRAYLSYLQGGDVVVLDISDKARPRMVAHIDSYPSLSKAHTTVPFPPLRGPGASKRKTSSKPILVVSEEALAFDCREPRPLLYVFDASDESHPRLISTFKTADKDFCERGMRFGPHQFAETKDGELIGGTLIYTAYFNAGLRIFDLSDPHNPKEVGHYIPALPKTGPEGNNITGVIQTNDVDLDRRGLIYITDRAGAGLHILEFTGKK